MVMSLSVSKLFFSVCLFCFDFFVCFWLRWVFVAVPGLSLVVASRGYSSLWCVGFSLQSMGSRCTGFSSCSTRAQKLQHTGPTACGLQQLQHGDSVVAERGLKSAGSVAVVHGLSCSAACGILPDQGFNLCPLHWQVDS